MTGFGLFKFITAANSIMATIKWQHDLVPSNLIIKNLTGNPMVIL